MKRLSGLSFIKKLAFPGKVLLLLLCAFHSQAGLIPLRFGEPTYILPLTKAPHVQHDAFYVTYTPDNCDATIVIPSMCRFRFDVIANDFSPEGSQLKLISVQGVSHGTVTISGNKILFIPSTSFYEAVRNQGDLKLEFTYQVMDEHGNISTATFVVDFQYPQIPFAGTGTPVAPPANHLLAEYLFNDPNNLGLDTSGNNRDGVLHGMFRADTGVSGSAAQFSRAQYIEIPDEDALSISESGFSVSFWAYQDNVGDWKGIVSKSNETESEWFIDNAHNRKPGTISAGVTAIDSNPILLDSSTASHGNWEHFVVVYTGADSNDAIYVYKNGQPEENSTIAQELGYENTDAPLTIGRSFNQLKSKYHFYSGLLDNVRIYSTPLTQDEVLWLHQEATPVATPPNTLVAIDDYYTIGNKISNFFFYFLAENDKSSDLDSVRVISITPPQNGRNYAHDTGLSTRYIPDDNFCGYDYYDYTIQDSTGATDTGRIHLMVPCGITNSQPISISDTFQLKRNETITVDILSNDTENDLHDLDIIAVNKVNGESEGEVRVNNDDTVTYFPPLDYCGTTRFSYFNRDIYSFADGASIYFEVECSNRRPNTTPDYLILEANTSITVNLAANDVDPDGDQLTVAAVFNPQNGIAVLNADRTVTYTPNVEYDSNNNVIGYCGQDYFSYDVVDPDGLFWYGVANVTVNCTPVDTVTLQDDTVTIDRGATVYIDVLENDIIPASKTVSVVELGTPNSGTSEIVTTPAAKAGTLASLGATTNNNTPSSNLVKYTHDGNHCALDEFPYTTEDSGLLRDTAKIKININCSPNLPQEVQALGWNPSTAVIGQPSTLIWDFINVESCVNTITDENLITGSESRTYYEPQTVITHFTCTDSRGKEIRFATELVVDKLPSPANFYIRQQ